MDFDIHLPDFGQEIIQRIITETIKSGDILSGISNAFKDAFSDILSGISSLIPGGIKDAVNNALKFGGDVVSNLQNLPESLLEMITTALRDAIKLPELDFSSIVEGITSKLGEIAGSIGDFVTPLVESARQALGNMGDVVGKAIRSLADDAFGSMRAWYNGIAQYASDVIAKTTQLINEVRTQCFSAVQNMMTEAGEALSLTLYMLSLRLKRKLSHLSILICSVR